MNNPSLVTGSLCVFCTAARHILHSLSHKELLQKSCSLVITIMWHTPEVITSHWKSKQEESKVFLHKQDFLAATLLVNISSYTDNHNYKPWSMMRIKFCLSKQTTDFVFPGICKWIQNVWNENQKQLELCGIKLCTHMRNSLRCCQLDYHEKLTLATFGTGWVQTPVLQKTLALLEANFTLKIGVVKETYYWC